MTLCPIALAVGCQKCPVFKICPVKSVIGDMPKTKELPAAKPVAKPATRSAAKTAAARKKPKKK